MQFPGKEFNWQQSPVAVFSLFRLQPGYKWWAFRQMGLAGKHFRDQPKLRFGEMLGTGKGRGFSLQPDFTRYALFTCWNSIENARNFLRHSVLHRALKVRSQEVFTTELLPFLSKGKWQGKEPFEPVYNLSDQYNGPVVALTRARIRLHKAFEFWWHVPGVSRETMQVEGLLAQTGIGELPLLQQGTLSMWQNEEQLKAFAYGMRKHKEVVHKTRSRHWYSEELFARFVPLQAEGSWNGRNPLQEYLPITMNASNGLVF